MPSSSLVEVEVRVEVKDEVEVGVEVKDQVGVDVEVILLFRVGGWSGWISRR